MKGIYKVTGLVLMAVSMVFTVQLLASFATNGFDKLVYAAFGIAIQTCQVLAYLHCAQTDRPLAMGIFAGLFVLSLVGTVGFFSVNDSRTLQQAQSSDTRFALMKERSESLQNQIQGTQGQIRDYSARSIMTKGVLPARAELKALNADQAKLHDEMMSFTPDPPSQALYGFLSEFFQCAPGQVKLALFVAYAIALDLCSVFLLSVSAGLSVQPVRTDKTNNSSDNRQAEVVVEQPQASDQKEAPALPVRTSTDNTLSDLKQRYLDCLKAGKRKNGSLPGQRRTADELNISNDQAQAIHQALKREGVLEVRGTNTFFKEEVMA